MSLLSPQLQAFMSVVRNHSVHAAARDLGLTQTAVTSRLRALEGELKATLFVRSRQGMRPTPEGEALIRYCQGALDLEGSALSQISGAGREAEIQIVLAGPTSVMNARVVPALTRIYTQFPKLYLCFEIDDTENRANLLRQGRYQLAILPPDQVAGEMDSKMLKPDRFQLFGPVVWKNRKLSDVIKSEKIIDFYESDTTTYKYLKKFDLLESAQRTRLFANSNESLVQLISDGVGYGTLTEEIAAPFVAAGRIACISSRPYEEAQALAWYPRPQMPDYFKEIVRTVR